MNERILDAADTGFVPAPLAAGDRVRHCEAEIEWALQKHNCRLSLSQFKIDGKVLHQEIIVIDAKE